MSDYPPGLPTGTPTTAVLQPHDVPAYTGTDMWFLFAVAFILLGAGVGLLVAVARSRQW